jgi:hypothetical protein
LVFEKKTDIISAENWQKSQKIVIIKSTPGHTDEHAMHLPTFDGKSEIALATTSCQKTFRP